MTRQQFEQYLYQQKQQNPYANYLENAFNALEPDKQDFFLEHIAREDKDPKLLMGFAKIVGEGRDPSSCLNMDYYDLARVNFYDLPEIATRQQEYAQHNYMNAQQTDFMKNLTPSQGMEYKQLTPDERIGNIISEHVTGASNSYYCQANVSTDTIAHQGWKFHVAADNKEDYARLCETLVPDLAKNGVLFKVVRPEMFDVQMAGDQIGKAITIYGGPGFDLNKLSPESRAILGETCQTQVYGDARVDGRVFARYGTFHKSRAPQNYITGPDGQALLDPKYERKVCPDSISFNKNDILNFYSQSEQKFAQTGDYRAFLQERETMAFCDGQNYAYASFKFDPKDIGHIQSALRAHDVNTSLSFVTSHEVSNGMGGTTTEYLLMVHKSAMTAGFNYNNGEHAFNSFHSPLLQDITNRGVNLERPEWDYRGAAFIVPNNSTPQLEELCSRTAGLGAYIGTTENGTAFIQCDTMFVDTLKDSLENEFNLPFSVYDPTLENDARDFVNQMFDYGQKGEISMDEIIQGFTMEQGDFEPDIAE